MLCFVVEVGERYSMLSTQVINIFMYAHLKINVGIFVVRVVKLKIE